MANVLVKLRPRVEAGLLALAGGIVLVAGLYGARLGHTQSGSEVWLMPTYYPSPSGEYRRLACREIRDYNNNEFYANANGLSVLKRLRMGYPGNSDGNITMRSGSIIRGASSYSIDLNNTNTGKYSVDIHSIETIGRIAMGAVGAPSSGQLVYDVAEGMAFSGEIEAGDVVVVDEATGALRRCGRMYDQRVAGVISEDPKVYLGPGPDKQPLALSGVVPCKASAENGPIAAGDLLVSAAVPGHAMKAEADRVEPGMVVGKALGPLLTGTGKIRILVNKQ